MKKSLINLWRAWLILALMLAPLQAPAGPGAADAGETGCPMQADAASGHHSMHHATALTAAPTGCPDCGSHDCDSDHCGATGCCVLHLPFSLTAALHTPGQRPAAILVARISNPPNSLPATPLFRPPV